MSEPADEELLRRHVDGDPDAFGELFRRHRDRLWAVALRTTGDPETAADALQEAMISAFRRADSFRGEARLTTWLHRIVVNSCLDQLRRSASRRAEPLPEDLDRSAELADRGSSDPTDRVGSDQAVLAALRTLPEDQRAAIVLVDLEGYSVAEAAEILGCPTGTVKSRCARGRARLLPWFRARHPRPADAPAPGNRPERRGVEVVPDASSEPDQSTRPAGGEP